LDIRFNEINSKVNLTNSQATPSHAVMQEIVNACRKALKEELAAEKRLENERKLSSGGSSDDY
jgi:hypothetical protein